MSDTHAVDRAVKRLSDALDALDAAMETRLEADRRRGTLAEEAHDFSMDRSRLAAELDDVQAHSRALETTNREAARRLDEAMDMIRGIIEAHQR
jgi:predicted  nucleic acid-binding Zn-ribbon protein